MKKIFSFFVAMLCATLMLTVEAAKLVIPTVDHATINVSRNGTPLANGDEVNVGETLIVSYAASHPWYIEGASSVEVTVPDDGAEEYTVPAPSVYGKGTVQFGALQHTTLEATLNGVPFTGGEVRIGDMLDYSYRTVAHYLFIDCDCDQRGFGITLYEDQFDSEGVMTINEPETYYVPASGKLMIPTVPHVTTTVTREGVEIAHGDTVTEGETLEISYTATEPWYIDGDNTKSVTLTADMFNFPHDVSVDFAGNGWTAVTPTNKHQGRSSGWKIQMPTYNEGLGSRSISATTELYGDTKIPFIWSIDQGFINYGKFFLRCYLNGEKKIEHDFTVTPNDYSHMIYDTLSFVATGAVEIRWECVKTYKNWGDDTGRAFYLDSILLENENVGYWYSAGVPQVGMVGNVQFAEPRHTTFIATLNGAPFAGGKVNVGDELEVIYKTQRGYLFNNCDCDSIGMSKTLAESDFDSEAKLTINEPETYLLDPILSVTALGSTAEISWDGYGVYDSYRLLVATEEPTGNPDYWKGVQTLTDTVYTLSNLIAGQVYYVYLQPFIGDEASSWIKQKFTAGLGGSCEFTIIMNDADGDGWTGCGLRIIEDGVEEFITLESGRVDTAYYQSYGDTVTVVWNKGSYADEVSFRIVDGNGLLLAEVKEGEASYFSDGEILFNQVLCDASLAPECRARVANLTATVDTTHFELNWVGLNATKYEVAVLQKSNPTEAELEAAAVATTDTSYSFVGNEFGIYNAFVRTECPDGAKTKWQNILMYKDTILRDSVLFAMSQPIELGYERKGDLMEYAIASDDEAVAAYTFSLIDSTDVVLTFMPTDMSGYGWPGEIDVYKFDSTYKFLTDIYISSMLSLDSGTYVIMPRYYLNCGEYTLSVKEYVEPEPIKTDTITLDFTETGDFTTAQDWAPAGAPVSFLAHGYTFIPEDSVLVWINVTSSNTYGGVGIFLMEGENILYSGSANNPRILTLAQDSVYTFYVVMAPMYGGSVTDDYTFTIKALDSIPAAEIIPVVPNTTFEGVITNDDVVFELGGQQGKVYEFVLNRDAYVTFSLDPTAETSANANLSYRVIRDSLSNSASTVYGGQITNSNYGFSNFSGTEEGTHYFIFVYGQSNEPFSFTLRADPDYRDVPVKDTLEVGEKVASVLNAHDGFTYHNWPGEYDAYSVRLEKNKSYKVMAHRLDKGSSNIALTVFSTDTVGKDYTYNDNKVAYSTSSSEGWNVVTFTPDTTADFTIMIDGYINTSKSDSIVYELVVLDYVEFFNDFISTAQVVSAPYTEEGIFSGNKKVYWDGSYNFNTPVSYITYYAGIYDAVAYAVPVAAGDTLFAEFGGDHDAALYIYDFNDANAGHDPIVADSIEYAYPYEHTFYVNNTKLPRIVVVVGAMREVLLEDATWSIRLAVGTEQLQNEIVTAKATAESVTVYDDATPVEIFAALGELGIDLVDADNNVIGSVVNNLSWWRIAEDGETASYELNASDLPIGYSFAADKEYVVVTINYVECPLGFEEIVVEKTVKAQKILYNGQIFILRDGKMYTIMGQLVR